MNIRQSFLLVLLSAQLWIWPSVNIYAQTDTARQYVQLSLLVGYTSNDVVPFWMRSNQFGSIPLDGVAGGILVRAAKNYAIQGEWTERKDKAAARWDWGYGVEARTNVGHKAQVQLIDAHVKVRYAMFEAKLGRTKDVMGLNGDTLLNSGNFAVSGNALGIPVLDIRIPVYYRLPWFDGLFSFKGNFANGYMGKSPVDPQAFVNQVSTNEVQTLLHQKSLYARLGREDWKLQLYGGFNHQVQHGGEREVYGAGWDLSYFEQLLYVAVGAPYGGRGSGIPRSKVGNHQGSIDLAFSYDWNRVRLLAYRQNFYDVGALAKLANIADGLNGIAVTNKFFKKEQKNLEWKAILFEFFYSKDQAGYPWSRSTKSGDENYYNNFFYLEGWSYKTRGIGSPLIVPTHEAKEEHVSHPRRYFVSNRVSAVHFGGSGNIYDWTVVGKLTYARHFGTFATSEYGSSLGNVFTPPEYGVFTPVSQFSAFLDAERELSNNFFLGVRLAADHGGLFDNSLGGQISLRKLFQQR